MRGNYLKNSSLENGSEKNMKRDLLESCLILREEGNAINGEQYFPVFVLLTHTGTILSNIIKDVTKVPYSHSSISFDSSLKNMYSFGRKYKNNPLIGMFVKENIQAGLYADVAEKATFSLYVTFVSLKEKGAMEEKLSYFLDNKDKFKYNFIGLIKNKMGKTSNRDDAYFCSQFVDTVLKAGKSYFNKDSSLVRPYDFARNKQFQFVMKGTLIHYNSGTVDIRVKTLMDKFIASNQPVIKLTKRG